MFVKCLLWPLPSLSGFSVQRLYLYSKAYTFNTSDLQGFPSRNQEELEALCLPLQVVVCAVSHGNHGSLTAARIAAPNGKLVSGLDEFQEQLMKQLSSSSCTNGAAWNSLLFPSQRKILTFFDLSEATSRKPLSIEETTREQQEQFT